MSGPQKVPPYPPGGTITPPTPRALIRRVLKADYGQVNIHLALHDPENFLVKYLKHIRLRHTRPPVSLAWPARLGLGLSAVAQESLAVPQ